jgi:hypothetical protein
MQSDSLRVGSSGIGTELAFSSTALRSRRTKPSIFELLGCRQGDIFEDLYPGSGGMSRAWEIFQDSAFQEPKYQTRNSGP